MAEESPIRGTAWERAESANGRKVAQVMLDTALPQLDHLFDYAVPEHLADEIRVGHRVRVPFRSQQRRSHGYVVGFLDRTEFGGELQSIAEIVSPVPQLTPQVWRLARSLADRAGGSASDVLRLAIPKRLVGVERKYLESGEVTHRWEGEPFELGESEAKLAAALLQGSRMSLTPSHGPVRLSTGEWVGGWAVQLARLALAVYFEGRSVILAVPDYRDIDQLADTLDSLGHRGVIRVDSRQSNSARYGGFLRALEAEPRIILGNRSAVYAPAHSLGAVIMWDDGDPLYGEPLAPYVHARDAALVRATLESEHSSEQSAVGLVFASHARSAEVQRLIEIGYVTNATPAPVRGRVIPAEDVQHTEAMSTRVPEFAARMLREGVTSGPVLVQVANPGYAPMAVCDGCGERVKCQACQGPIVFRGVDLPVCRWCGTHAHGWRCGECGSGRMSLRGAGSQRTAEQFQLQFPGVRVVLSDGEHPHARVDSRPAIVVATRGAEPIAAGGYLAVVLLDVEKLLSIESLRAGEDCLRWWSNAAALAAPEAPCVLASGGGPVVRAFATGRIDDWLREELRDRQLLRYPPAVRAARVTGGSAEVERALQALGDLQGVDTLGPTPELKGDDDGSGALVRVIVRFDYAQGAEVAKRLRGAMVADAAGSSSRIAGRAPGRARQTALRIRFDDRDVFDSW